jgi:hypothetical protein
MTMAKLVMICWCCGAGVSVWLVQRPLTRQVGWRSPMAGWPCGHLSAQAQHDDTAKLFTAYE